MVGAASRAVQDMRRAGVVLAATVMLVAAGGDDPPEEAENGTPENRPSGYLLPAQPSSFDGGSELWQQPRGDPALDTGGREVDPV